MTNVKLRAATLVAAGVVGGGVLAGTLGASAAGASGGSSSSTTAPSYGQPPAGARFGPGGAQPGRADERLVTGSTLTTLKAEALTAVPGGTVVRVETDAGDGAYEAHMTKSDGSAVTVKFDNNLKVIGVEDGMGKGDPAPAGAPSGAPSGTTTG